MATCPNVNLQEWKDLVISRGEEMAYYLWDKHEGEVPEIEGFGRDVIEGKPLTTMSTLEEYTNLFGEEVRTEPKEDFEEPQPAFDNKEEYDNYLKNYNDRLRKYNNEEVTLQKAEMSASRTSEETLTKVREIAKKMGVKMQTLQEYLKGNPNVEAKTANALTDLLHGIIAIAEGKENIALTEEMVHVATVILEQKNPSLITEMIGKIDRFSIYTRTLNAYKTDKNYQFKDGKPDIRKIKKEAVDKLIAELIINKNEGDTEFPELREETNKSLIRTWWQKILDWFRGQYRKANVDIFETAAEKITNEELGNINELNQQQIYLQNEFSKNTNSFGQKIQKNSIPRDFKLLFSENVNKDSLDNISSDGYKSFELFMHSPLFQKINGRTFKNISEGRVNLERREVGQYTIIRVLQSLFENSFNKELAKKLGVGSIMVVNSSREHPLYIQNKILTINLNEGVGFFNHIIQNSTEKTEKDLIDTAVSEELIHLVSTKIANPTEVSKAYSELTQEDKVQILQTYFHDDNLVNTTLLKPHEYVHEYVRMQIQKKVLGWTTEEKRTTLAKIIDKVWNYLKDLLPKYTSLKSIYDKTLNFIKKGEGELNETSSNEILGLPQIVSEPQRKYQQLHAETQANVRKVEGEGKVDPVFQDTEEADNWYELKKADGTWDRKAVKKRVTDRVKDWFKKRFPGRIFTNEEKERNETKRKFGVKAHAFLDEIHNRWFNPDGTKKDIVVDRPSIDSAIDREVYSKLERYYSDFIDKLFEDGKHPLVFSEDIMYDPKQKEAGTLDLFVVDEDGSGYIIDWKFLESGKGEDIQWYKQGAFDIQLGRYKEIARDFYGIKNFKMIRAIPFLIKMEREKEKDVNSPFRVTGITTGNVDVSKIQNLKLVPVSEKTESTGFEEVDTALENLNAVMNQIAKEKPTTEDEREFKNERLNAIRVAMREARRFNLTPLIKTINSVKIEGDNIIDDWKTIYRDKPATAEDIGNKQISDFGVQMKEYLDMANTFGEFSDLLRDLIYRENKINEAKTEEEKEAVKDAKETADGISEAARKIRGSRAEVKKIMEKFVDKYEGERNRVMGILLPEAVVKGLTALFGNITELPMASLQVLQKLVTTSNMNASRVAFDQVGKLMSIRDILIKRGNVYKLVQQIYQKDDKGKLVNKLIYRFSKDFYDGIKENAEEGKRNKQWIKDNIDLVKYKEKATEVLNKKIARLKRDYRNDDNMLSHLVSQELQKWDIDGDLSITIEGFEDVEREKFNGWDNYLIKRYPLEKWYSEEYKTLVKDPELLSLYDFITEINSEAEEAGYIDGAVRNTFLPFVTKSMAESFVWGLNPSVISTWFDKLKGVADSRGGTRNELTGELEHSIPKYFTYDFTKKGKGEREFSEEIFKNMAMYINHMQKYKNLKTIEGQIKALQTVESFKNHLNTNVFGNIRRTAGNAEIGARNEKNTETLDKFVRVALYNERYPGSDIDIDIGMHPFNAVGKIINNVAGREVFKVDENPDPVSLIKTMDALNNYFRVKTLGFNVISGAAVYFGSNMQVLSQAGKYYKGSEFLANTIKLMKDKFLNDNERKMFLKLMDVFVPIRSDRINREIRKAGISSPFSRTDFSGTLMSVLTEPSEYVEKSIFMSLLQNMMIEDGKITNISDYVNNKYTNRWESAVIHDEVAKKIKTEIAELKKTRSIDAIKHLDEKGELVIPGLDLSNIKEIQRLTNLTRTIARTSTHGRTAADINQASMNIWTNSMLVFKTWIPKLMISRFQHFEKVSDDFSVKIDDNGNTEGERYDVGRFRLFLYVMGQNMIGKSTNIINILSANQKGVESLDQMYEDFARDYNLRTGKVMNLSREDFFDLIRTNLKNEIRELAILTSLVGMLFATGYFAPGSDEDKAAKNAHHYYIRILDKFVGQLSFFYNPIEIQKMLSGGMFPALGIFGDLQKFTHSLIMETTGFDSSNPLLSADEVAKKAQPIKYGMEMFPAAKPFITWMSMFDADFAKEFNVTVSQQNRR